MHRSTSRRPPALCAFALLALVLAAAAPAPGGAQLLASDPAHAGPDFAVQGEYAGKIGAQKLGAQVIALGAGTFQAVFLPGGLPGEGWDGKTRVRVEGRSDGGVTTIGRAGAGWNGSVAGGNLDGQSEEGTPFHLVHVVRDSPAQGLKPPEGAKVLFDGKDASPWLGAKITPEGLLQPGCRTAESFSDFRLHVEFRLPFKPEARGQSRGNSGVYLQERYEVQVLDSFGLDGKANECGGIYRQTAPAVNMCFPPLSWQTYDLDFRMARFDAAGAKTANAVITLRHNGVRVHDRVAISGPTGHGKPEIPAGGPVNLQNHGNPVLFRNIWIVPQAAATTSPP